MDAKTLAIALVSGGRSESEKVRLIKSTFPPEGGHMTPADVAYVQQRLGADRRLSKLSLEFADASRNKEFAISELHSGNTFTPGQVAARFHWLYTTDILLNEAFLLNDFGKLSHSVRHRVLTSIGRHTVDDRLGDQLWRIVRANYSLRYSNSLLAACSNDLIVREMSLGKAVELTDAQMLCILRKRFESGVELLRTLWKLKKDKILKQEVEFKNAIGYILHKDLIKGFNILVDTDTTVTFGASRTRSLLKALLISDADTNIKERIVKYSRYLHRDTLRQFLPNELYLQYFLEINANMDPDSEYDVKVALSGLRGFDRSVKRRFLEALYQKKYNKSIMEVPMRVFPEMLYLLSEQEWTGIVNSRLQNKDYMLSREFWWDPSGHFWKAMLPCKLSFPSLKDLLVAEHDTDSRELIFKLMINSAVMQHDKIALEEQLKFVLRKCQKEAHEVTEMIIRELDTYLRLKDRPRIDMWPLIRDFVEFVLRKNSTNSYDMFDVLFCVLQTINPKDTGRFNEIVGFISKAHIRTEDRWPYSFRTHMQMIPKHDPKLILKIILSDQEEFLKEKLKKHFSGTEHIWRAFTTIRDLKMKIDFTQYPANLALLKHIVSPDAKVEEYMNEDDNLKTAYELVKDFLGNDFPLRSRIERNNTEDFEKLEKRIRKTEDVSELNLKVLLDDKYASKVWLKRRIIQLLVASDSLTPDILNEALGLSAEDDHRLAATQFLAMSMPLDDFMKHFGKFIPKQSETNGGEIDPALHNAQEALILATKVINDIPTALGILSAFMGSDHTKMAADAFDCICSRSPPDMVIPILSQSLTDCSATARKHFLRWYLLYSQGGNANLTEAITANEKCSTKLKLLKAAYREVEDKGDEAWPTLKSCFDIVKYGDRHCIDFIFREHSIDDRLIENAANFFGLILSFGERLSEKQWSHFATFLCQRAIDLKLPQNVGQEICKKVLELDLTDGNEEFTDYIKDFVLRDVPINCEFLMNQLDSLVERKVRFAENNLRRIVKNLCPEIVERKQTDGTDFSIVLQKLLELLTGYVEQFFPEKVHVELVQIVLKLIPGKEANKQAFGAFINEYTLQGIELLSERLDQLGTQVLGILMPLLVDTIKPFVYEYHRFQARMLELYKREMRPQYAWFFIDCLPAKTSEYYEADRDVYDGFVNAIQAGSDVTLKVMLNSKLHDLEE